MAVKTMFDKISLADTRKTALEYLGENFSYKKLFYEIDRAACKLKQSGLKKGDCVAIALPNSVACVVLIYACNKLGLVCNMLHPLLPLKKLVALTEFCESKMLFVADVVANKYVKELIANTNFSTVVCKTEDYLHGFRKLAVSGKVSSLRENCKGVYCLKDFLSGAWCSVESTGDENSPAVIMHGGGTTGEPESVVLTNKNFNVNADAIVNVIGDDAKKGDGVMLAAIPFFHAFGFGTCLHTMLCNNVKVVLMPAYSSSLAVKMLAKGNITYLAGVPTMFDGLTAQKNFECAGLKSLRYAFSGSDVLPASVKDKFDYAVRHMGGKATLDEGYGLTEGCGVTSVNTRPSQKDGSLGKYFYNFSVEAFSPDGKLLPRETTGELCMSSDALFLGYFKDVKTTNQVKFVFNGDVWLKTGDRGYVDFDNHVFFVDRLKRIAKVSGITVFPSEVERVIEKVEGVARCCVIRAAHKHKGTVLKAVLQVKEGFAPDDVLSRAKDECRASLGKWETPYAWTLQDVPLSDEGKADFVKLESQATN